MKNSIAKFSETKKWKSLSTRWTVPVILITAFFLPAGAVAQDTPTGDPAAYQQQAEVTGYQNNYQQPGTDPNQQDFSNPYQQPVTSQYEQDQKDFARWSLGVPLSRRPQFSNFFAAEERAIRSREEKRRDEEFELQKELLEFDEQ